MYLLLYNWVKGIDNDCNEWELDKDYYNKYVFQKYITLYRVKSIKVLFQ